MTEIEALKQARAELKAKLKDNDNKRAEALSKKLTAADAVKALATSEEMKKASLKEFVESGDRAKYEKARGIHRKAEDEAELASAMLEGLPSIISNLEQEKKDLTAELDLNKAMLHRVYLDDLKEKIATNKDLQKTVSLAFYLYFDQAASGGSFFQDPAARGRVAANFMREYLDINTERLGLVLHEFNTENEI